MWFMLVCFGSSITDSSSREVISGPVRRGSIPLISTTYYQPPVTGSGAVYWSTPSLAAPVKLWCNEKDRDRSGKEKTHWGNQTGRWGCERVRSPSGSPSGPAVSCDHASCSGSQRVVAALWGLLSPQTMKQKIQHLVAAVAGLLDLQQTHWKMRRG